MPAMPTVHRAVSAGLDPTQGATQCTDHLPNRRTRSTTCTPCDANSYRLAGDQIFGGDTHCFCRDNQKVINKACVACEEGSNNPNLCYSSLKITTVCATKITMWSTQYVPPVNRGHGPAGDYAGNGDTHCFAVKTSGWSPNVSHVQQEPQNRLR